MVFDWKSIKGEGPWPFTAQEDKWGYLNNPRWQPTPLQPEINYTGNEANEPQVWKMEGEGTYSIGSSIRHLPCGHWHKKRIPPQPNVYFLWEGSSFNKIVRIKNPEFTYTFGAEITPFSVTTDRAIIDPNNQYYYIGASGDLYKIDLPAGTTNSSISISSYTNRNIVTLVVDRYNRILYAITTGNDENPCYIFKIDLATFSIIDYGTLILPTQLPYPIITAVIDDVNNDYIYAGGFAYFYRIDISTLAYHDRVLGLGDPVRSVIDIVNRYAYFAGAGGTQKIGRLNLSSFTKDELIIPTGNGSEIGMGIDLVNGFLYHVPPPEVVLGLTTTTLYQISTTDFSIKQSAVLNADGFTQSIVVDPVNQKVFAGMVGTSTSVRRFNAQTYLQQDLIYYGHSAQYGVMEGQNTV